MQEKGKETKISEKFGKIDLKEQKEEYYSKGYIATTHVDSVGDKIPVETLQKWGDNINSTNLSSKSVSIHHDRDDMNLAGRGTEGTAKVEKLEDGEYGLFVETQHNKTHPKFADTVYQIENDFLTHYSIEYDTQGDSTTHREETDDGWVRVIEPDTNLVGYGLASPRTVVNENAAMIEAGYKELVHIKEKGPGGHEPDGTGPHGNGAGPGKGKKDGSGLKNKKKSKEADKMADKKEDVKAEEAPAEEKNDAPESKTEAPVEKTEEKPAEPAPAEEKEKVDVKELKETIRKDIMAEIKEKVEEKKPIIAAKEKIESKEVEMKERVAYKEKVFGEKKASLSVQWKESAKLHDALEAKGLIKQGSMKGSDSPFEVKEQHIEFKGLDTDSNYVGAQTNYWDALDHYEQTPAELNDIYGPVIISQFNEMNTAYNLLPKDDMSGASAIRFRVKTARPTADGSVSYGSTPTWDSNAGRQKINVNFVTYRQDVQVEFEEIELAKAPGGIGDVYALEMKDATETMMTTVNSDLLTSSTTPAEGEPYTFEKTVITSGTLYGKDLSTYTALQAASVTNASSAPITLERMRKMIDDVKARGATTDSLAFICHYTQSRKFKTLIQNIQRTVPTSARVGFEGRPELDGVPVFEDYQCNTDDLWLIDLKHTRFAIKKAPTYVEFGLVSLNRRGIIWMMGNLYCTKPGNNAWTYGLKTT